MTCSMQIRGVWLEVEASFIPGEPETLYEPGMGDDAEVMAARVGGVDIFDLVSDEVEDAIRDEVIRQARDDS